MLYVKKVEDLGCSGKVMLYGAGSRGRDVLQAIRRLRPDLTVAGFLDSRRAGEFEGLPVVRFDDYTRQPADAPFAGAAIVITSTHYEAIEKTLEKHGVVDYDVVLLEPDGVPFTRMPARCVADNLHLHPHPLAVSEKDRPMGEDIHYSCARFRSLMLRPSGVSLCCWIPDLADGRDPIETLDRIAAVSNHLMRVPGKALNALCRHCPELCRVEAMPAPGRLTNVDIDTSIRCNLCCSYCQVSNTIDQVDYDYKALLEHGMSQGYFEDAFRFSFGGFGEPVLNPDFAEITANLLARGGHGLIYTNAIVFSESIEQGLREGKLTIEPSLDAGSPETYALMRGADKYEVVWKHIARYVRANPRNVLVKYVVTEQNCSPEEITGFIERCLACGVQVVCISKDFYCEEMPECVRSAVFLLAELAQQHGISHFLLPVAFSQAMIAAVAAAVSQ